MVIQDRVSRVKFPNNFVHKENSLGISSRGDVISLLPLGDFIESKKVNSWGVSFKRVAYFTVG